MIKYILAFSTLALLVACKPHQPATPVELFGEVIVSERFDMPGLDRSRQIRIYLPPGYHDSDETYPVIYLHDGQNLFEDSTSYAGEMGVDEVLDSLAFADDFRMIAVGIDNGQERRLNEMSPWNHEQYGAGEGRAYMDFIVHTVKPYVDSLYRTRSGRDDTAILGASLGGFITHYAICQYPDIFSKAGIFSPSYWYVEDIYDLTRSQQPWDDARLYMLVGGKEGAAMVDGARTMDELLSDIGHPPANHALLVDPEGEHNEAFWGRHFPTALVWMYDLSE